MFQICALAALFGGCATIRSAREAQRDPELLAASGLAPSATRERVNLAGLDFSGLVDFAITNRPNVRIAALSVERARLALADVKGAGLFVPQVSAAIGHSQSTANRSTHFSWRNEGGASGSVSLDMTLWDFGRVGAMERAARENLVAAERKLEETRLSVFSEVAESYFAVLRADALLEAALTNETVFAEHLARAESMLETGDAKKLDVTRARVDLSSARLASVNASNETVCAGITLLKALGLEPGRAGRDDALPRRERALESVKGEFEATSFSAETALELARTNSPSLLALRAKLRAASADVDRAVADLFPELTLSTAAAWSDPAWNWKWALDAAGSIFLGFRKTAAVDDAVAAMRIAEAETAEAEQELARLLALATAERDNARESLADAEEMTAQAKENLDLVEAEYALGEANRVDFTDAASAYAEALGERTKAFYAAQTAEAKLIELIGAR